MGRGGRGCSKARLLGPPLSAHTARLSVHRVCTLLLRLSCVPPDSLPLLRAGGPRRKHLEPQRHGPSLSDLHEATRARPTLGPLQRGCHLPPSGPQSPTGATGEPGTGPRSLLPWSSCGRPEPDPGLFQPGPIRRRFPSGAGAPLPTVPPPAAVPCSFPECVLPSPTRTKGHSGDGGGRPRSPGGWVERQAPGCPKLGVPAGPEARLSEPWLSPVPSPRGHTGRGTASEPPTPPVCVPTGKPPRPLIGAPGWRPECPDNSVAGASQQPLHRLGITHHQSS